MRGKINKIDSFSSCAMIGLEVGSSGGYTGIDIISAYITAGECVFGEYLSMIVIF